MVQWLTWFIVIMLVVALVAKAVEWATIGGSVHGKK